MNRLERIAYNYLIETLGIAIKGIIHRNNISPDFVADGTGYEVKRLVNKTIQFGYRQWDYLFEFDGPCFLLVFNKLDDLVATIPLAELSRNIPKWHQYHIREAPLDNPNSIPRQLWLSSHRKNQNHLNLNGCRPGIEKIIR